jgi:hypothetical protein
VEDFGWSWASRRKAVMVTGLEVTRLFALLMVGPFPSVVVIEKS